MAKTSFRQRFLHLPKFTFLKRRTSQTTKLIQKRPILSFIAALLILLVLIAGGNFLFKPKSTNTQTSKQPKQVQIYTIGSAPKVSTQAQIQNTGVITIMAQSAGIIQSVNVNEGDQVGKGGNLITLSSNYSGANAPAIQESIAAKQYQLAVDTFNSQEGIIQSERNTANLADQNTANLRDIANRADVDLHAIADLNHGMLVTIQQNITDLQAQPTDPTTTQQILQLEQAENQIQAAQNQVNQQILNTEYQASPSNPPTQLADLQKDITLKQLDLQEKSLQASKDIAGLQVALASIGSSMLHPTSPFVAKVEKVLVRPGQAVNPGTPLLVLSGSKQNITAVARVPESMARQISMVDDSTLHLGNSQVSTKPSFVSDVATDGLLYSVIYTIPDGYTNNLTDNDYVTVDIPVGLPSTSALVPFVPLDSIFQTQDQSYLYVAENGQAKTKTVTTGSVLGNYVEITQGLNSGDQVILDRNVVEGDKVQPQ